MTQKITLMIGGIQGEGLVSTGDILIKALSRLGYYTFGFRNFSSRIKGGHTNYIIEISTERVLACGDELDIFIAQDMESVETNITLLKKKGLLIHDSIFDPRGYFVEEDYNILSFPFTDIAKEKGHYIMKNSAVLGLLAGLLGIPIKGIEELVEDTFKNKGEKIVKENISVLIEGYKRFSAMEISTRYNLEKTPTTKRASMIGNEAVALGSLMAGCRFVSSYPITPASEIMEVMAQYLPKYNGIVMQTEDEISAITMAIGGAYAGARTMTATSGPGISLMMEGIGLAGMAEIPVVIADVQRVGPSTGLPTKHEQSDISFVYNSSHGEIPIIIVTPYSVEECFYQSIEAFNLAEKYQCPVIILSDLTLGLSRQTIEALDKNKIIIDRGKLAHEGELQDSQIDFKRYEFTEDNISLRSIPGLVGGIHKVTGLEHSLIGTPNNNPEIRRKMMDKRLEKIKELENIKGIDFFEKPHSDIFILTIGSNYGIVKKAIEDNNLSVSYGAFRRIKPLPIRDLKDIFERYSKVIIVENNATGQLTSIIKENIPYHDKIHSLLKYDGRPFEIREIISKIEELM